MNMPERYYQNKAFSFQDEVLRLIQKAGSPFYLTGGTALSRCYLHHRYSDDLDLFVNADLNFKTNCDKILSVLKERSGWKTEVGTVAETFVRLMLEKEGAFLKVDLVNDIRFHWGGFQECSIYYRVDNQRDILSNKLRSLSRRDIKDLADILFIAQTYEFEWEEIFEDAKQKDLWVDPLEICKIIDECPLELFRNIKWISSVNIEELHVSLKILRDDIFWGRGNSLAKAD
jgi:predicted nucleotidyltransferase component of viral defense system